MAVPKILKGTYVNIMMGDGSTTEVFTVVCGLTSRKLVKQLQHSDQYIRDCALPEGVPFRVLNVTGDSTDLTGSGVMDRSGLAALQAAYGITKNYRFTLTQPAGDPVYGGYYQAPFILTQIGITGTDADYTQADLTFLSNGAVTFTPVVGV